MNMDGRVAGEVSTFTLTPKDFGETKDVVFSQQAADSLVGQSVKVNTTGGVRDAAFIDGKPVEAKITASQLIDDQHIEITVQVVPIVIPDSIEGYDL